MCAKILTSAFFHTVRLFCLQNVITGDPVAFIFAALAACQCYEI